MSDTHNERGGDADPYDWDPVYAATTIAELQKQLAAATARAESATVLPERWRALIAERDAAVRRAEEATAERDELREYVAALNEAQVSLQSSSFEVGWWKGFKAMPTAGVHTQVLLDTVEYADELRALNVAAAVAPDAVQEARSATETAEDGVQASGSELEFEGRSAGLSEPELLADACDCECQPGQPCLCPERDCYCGPCRICGDNPQQPDDTTEDDRG